MEREETDINAVAAHFRREPGQKQKYRQADTEEDQGDEQHDIRRGTGTEGDTHDHLLDEGVPGEQGDKQYNQPYPDLPRPLDFTKHGCVCVVSLHLFLLNTEPTCFDPLVGGENQVERVDTEGRWDFIPTQKFYCGVELCARSKRKSIKAETD